MSSTKPSDAATLERAARLANRGMFVLALQRRRVQTVEPEDGDFLFRVWADWEFLIVALIRIRRSALVAAQVDQTNAKIMQAVARFDAALPDLRVMRNVAEHIDEYAVESERRHHRSIMRYESPWV